jgi:hypothetical protein
MANRVGDEEIGVIPPLSQQELHTDSRPSTRPGSSPPQDGIHTALEPHPARIDRSACSSFESCRYNDKLDVEQPEKWLWKKYGKHLVTKVQPWPFMSSKQGEESFEVNIAEMQYMYLVQLRIRLARHIARWEQTDGKEFLGGWNRQHRRNKDGNEDDSEKTEGEGCWEDDLHRYGIDLTPVRPTMI